MPQGNLQATENPNSGVATTIAASGVIRTQEGYQRVTAAGNVASLVLTPGVIGGETVIVANESAFTMTFATDATSNVLDGAAVIIVAKRARIFIWDDVAARWVSCSAA